MDISTISAINPMMMQSIRPTGETAETKARALQGTTATSAELEKLMSASQDFESFFVYMLLKEMRKTVQEGELFHGGRAEQIFRDMMDEELSKQMAKSPGNGLGIASMIYDQLSKTVIANVTPAANTTGE